MKHTKEEIPKEECEKALDCLSDDDKMDELAQKFSMDDDYTSYVNYEIARKWCYDQLKQCVDEHFSNPPLEWEELKEGMWIWDNKDKAYMKIESVCDKDWVWLYIDSSEREHIDELYEPNRFYRKEVVQE